MKVTKDNIWELAKEGDVEVLDHKDVAVLEDNDGETPLHILACTGKVEVLSHKDVAVVKDRDGWTPLHWLANEGKVEVLSHKDVAVLEDNDGETPLHILADQGKVKVKDLKKLFPWYQHKIGTKIDMDLITELINTPNSLKFILED